MIIFQLQFSGSAGDANVILAPFYALQPVAATNETAPIPGSAHASGSGNTDSVCQKGSSWYNFPVGLQTFNIEANRAVYNLYKKMVNQYPAMNASIVQFEVFPQEGVRAVESDSTAYAHRGDSLLVFVPFSLIPELFHLTDHQSSYTPFWPPSEPGLAAVADDYGHQARALFHAGDAPGRTLNTYVNYASTDETPEMLYGYEPWRLEKLRSLKKKYDPRGRFNFYNPIR